MTEVTPDGWLTLLIVTRRRPLKLRVLVPVDVGWPGCVTTVVVVDDRMSGGITETSSTTCAMEAFRVVETVVRVVPPSPNTDLCRCLRQPTD